MNLDNKQKIAITNCSQNNHNSKPLYYFENFGEAPLQYMLFFDEQILN